MSGRRQTHGDQPIIKQHLPCRTLLVISGSVAGMALGFDSAFWERAVVVDVWPLSILFFAMVICLMLRWHYSPEQRRHLYAAVFGYGLALCNSEALAVAAIGFEFMVVFTKPALGRGLFVFTTLMLATTSIGYWFKLLPDFWAGVTQIQWIWPVYPLVGVIVALVSGILIIKTSAIFTEWRKVLGCIFCLMLGLLPYLYLPIASMTTPPGNWGYPRTYEGSVHTISRGQYEVLRPTNDVGRFIGQIGIFAETTIVNFGVIYLALALVPFCFLHRMRPPERRWMFGLSCLFLCVSLLWLAMLNPSDDRAIIDLDKEFFTPAHLVLAVWSGYGLILLGKILSAPKPEASS